MKEGSVCAHSSYGVRILIELNNVRYHREKRSFFLTLKHEKIKTETWYGIINIAEEDQII